MIERELVTQASLPRLGQSQRSTTWNPADPAQFQQPVGQAGTEGSGQV